MRRAIARPVRAGAGEEQAVGRHGAVEDVAAGQREDALEVRRRQHLAVSARSPRSPAPPRRPARRRGRRSGRGVRLPAHPRRVYRVRTERTSRRRGGPAGASVGVEGRGERELHHGSLGQASPAAACAKAASMASRSVAPTWMVPWCSGPAPSPSRPTKRGQAIQGEVDLHHAAAEVRGLELARAMAPSGDLLAAHQAEQGGAGIGSGDHAVGTRAISPVGERPRSARADRPPRSMRATGASRRIWAPASRRGGRDGVARVDPCLPRRRPTRRARRGSRPSRGGRARSPCPVPRAAPRRRSPRPSRGSRAAARSRTRSRARAGPRRAGAPGPGAGRRARRRRVAPHAAGCAGPRGAGAPGREAARRAAAR